MFFISYLILFSPSPSVSPSFKPYKSSTVINNANCKEVIPNEKISDFSGLRFITFCY